MAPLIAVDLDEVLGSFVAPLCEFHNETYGTSLKLSDFTSYRFCEVRPHSPPSPSLVLKEEEKTLTT